MTRTQNPPATLTDLLFEKVSVGLCLVAPDGTVVRANAEWLRSTGFSEEQVVGENIIDLFPATRDMALAMHARARAGHRIEVPRHAQVVNGRDTWWDGVIEPVRMEGGTGLLITAREVRSCPEVPAAAARPTAIVRDLTEEARRRALELQLRASDERFRLLTEAMPQIVCVLQADGTVEYVNSAWTRFSGLDAAATARVEWRVIVHPEDVDVALECRRRVLKQLTPQDVEMRYRAADGTYRWFLSRLAPIVEGGRVVRFIGAGLEIEQRKRAEAALRESEERFRFVHEATQDVIWDWNLTSGDLVWNESLHRVFGWPIDEVPRVVSWWHESIHPDERDGVTASIQAVIDDPARRSWTAEYRFRHHDGHWAHVLDRGFVIRDGSGRGVRMIGSMLDVTARKEAEELLREADRHKDDFLATLSHELRNPLGPIRNSAYILRHATSGSEQAHRAQVVIERQTEHLTRLVDDLLDVTRISRGKIELRIDRIDLRDVVRRTAEDFRPSIEQKGVALRVSVPARSVWAEADATRLAQVLGNLLHNAAKFTRAGDEVTIALAAEDEAEIRVLDTGAGIDAALLPTLFQPFIQGERTLARSEGGLGLGLALVKGIATLHGGSVEARSGGTGHGAEFIVRLPLAEPASGGAGHEARPSPSSGRRVLVVDDNIDAAESLADVVRMLGHAAEVAYDGPTAIEKTRAVPPDVVLCDIGLPGMSGYDVAKAIRASLPETVQLIAVSGYAQPDDVKRAIEAGFDGHVAKPCDPEKIGKLLG